MTEPNITRRNNQDEAEAYGHALAGLIQDLSEADLKHYEWAAFIGLFRVLTFRFRGTEHIPNQNWLKEFLFTVLTFVNADGVAAVLDDYPAVEKALKESYEGVMVDQDLLLAEDLLRVFPNTLARLKAKDEQEVESHA